MKRMTPLLMLFVVSFAVMVMPVQANSMTITTANPAIASDGQCSIIEAIINANDDDQTGSTDCPFGIGADVIDLNGLTITFTTNYADYTGETALPQITSEITLQNGTLERSTTTSGRFRLLSIDSWGDLTVDNVTLQNGRFTASPGNGGAIYNDGTLTVTNSTFINNQGYGYGGAIFNNISRTATITNTTFTSNQIRSNGGAIANDKGTVTIDNSDFTGNYSTISTGGAIYNGRTTASTMTVTNSTFTGNSAGQFGGAIWTQDFSIMTIDGCTFSGNSSNADGGAFASNASSTIGIYSSVFYDNDAVNGGGLFLSGTVNMGSTLIYENTATDKGGGGIYLQSDYAYIRNTTITDNIAPAGGSIYRNGGRLYLYNSISWSNSTELYYTSGGYITVQNTIIEGGHSGTANLDVNPLFVDAANDDYRLQSTSPAISMGNPALGVDADGNPLLTDFEGEARIQNRYLEIGGDEYQVNPGMIVDMDNNGIVTPLDAIYVVNRIGTSDFSANSDGDVDVDGDDVLQVFFALE